MFFFGVDDDIRQNEGFKNVALGNVVSAHFKAGGRDKKADFLSAEDDILLKRWGARGYELQASHIKIISLGN